MKVRPGNLPTPGHTSAGDLPRLFSPQAPVRSSLSQKSQNTNWRQQDVHRHRRRRVASFRSQSCLPRCFRARSPIQKVDRAYFAASKRKERKQSRADGVAGPSTLAGRLASGEKTFPKQGDKLWSKLPKLWSKLPKLWCGNCGGRSRPSGPAGISRRSHPPNAG